MSPLEPISRGEAQERLRELQMLSDHERAHREGDQVLCRLLTTLGCGGVVREWEKLRRWYS